MITHPVVAIGSMIISKGIVMPDSLLKIGELAKLTGSQVETVRYYEQEGLLPAPNRSAGNYRLYGTAHV